MNHLAFILITTRSSTNIESEGKEERDDDTSNTNQASGNSDTSPVTTSECKVKPQRKKLSDHQAVLNKIDEELERAREENDEAYAFAMSIAAKMRKLDQFQFAVARRDVFI